MRRHAAAFHARATAAGLQLVPDQSVWWLTRYGHASPSVQEQLPSTVLDALRRIFSSLGGDERALAAKTRVLQVRMQLLPVTSGEILGVVGNEDRELGARGSREDGLPDERITKARAPV